MTIFTLSLNNFFYDIEDNIFYHRDNSFRVKIVEFQTHNEFYLYYGGYDNYIGSFTDEEIFIKKMKDYNIKILRYKKLKELELIK